MYAELLKELCDALCLMDLQFNTEDAVIQRCIFRNRKVFILELIHLIIVLDVFQIGYFVFAGILLQRFFYFRREILFVVNSFNGIFFCIGKQNPFPQ